MPIPAPQPSGSEREAARIADLLKHLPPCRSSVLDVGARDGRVSRFLAQHFDRVVALDLERPAFQFPRVETVQGDVTGLRFPDASFDCVLCSEVLEHVPQLERACSEIARVARHAVIIGVPFRQDIRFGRTRCRVCGRTSPPYGHVNSFTEKRLLRLFPGCTAVGKSLIGRGDGSTTALAAWLMDRAGNPYGTYNQQEGCVHCGAGVVRPTALPPAARWCAGIARRMDRLQARIAPPRPYWIHVVFAKTAAAHPAAMAQTAF